jgi:DNA-binding HxlR family transcriptional regulator
MSEADTNVLLENRDAWSDPARCSIKRALDVVGKRSSILILREAHYGTHRFEEFVRRVEISEAVAAARLRELVDEGLLARKPYREPGQRTRDEYWLTEKGRDLYVVLVALMQWGDRWLTPDGVPVEFVHADCGEPVYAELRCAAGHRVTPRELQLVPGQALAELAGELEAAREA